MSTPYFEVIIWECIFFVKDFLFDVQIDVDYTVAVIEHWQQALTFAEDSSISKEVQAYISLVSSTAYRKCVQHDETVGLLEKQLRPIPNLSPWGTACALSLLLNMLDSFGCCELSPVVGCFPSLSSLKVCSRATMTEVLHS